MSKSSKINITCPHCQSQFSATIWDSVNTDLKHDLPQRVIDLTFFDTECPKCKEIIPLRYSILYNDMKHHKMVWALYPNSNTNEIGAFPYTGSTRRVDSIEELSEVVCAIENDRDDLIIELYKAVIFVDVFSQELVLGSLAGDIRYLCADGHEMFSCPLDNGRVVGIPFDEETYDRLYFAYFSRLKEMNVEPFRKYDIDWAIDFIANNSVNEALNADESDIPGNNELFYCRKCGKRIVADSVYCSYCGYKLSVDSSTEPKRENTDVKSCLSQNNIEKKSNGPVSASQKKTGFFEKNGAIIGVVIALLIIVVLIGLGMRSPRTSTVPTSQVTTQTTKPYPIQTAYNGQILKKPPSECVAPLAIKTEGTQDYYIYLKDEKGTNDMAFYVRGGKTAEVDVPLGTYEIYYATGPTWYGKTHLFGDSTVRYKCEGTFRFYIQGDYYQGWTLELYEQAYGNMDTELISESEFPG